MNFNELKISDSLKQAIRNKGFKEPSEVQEKTIPAALEGKDFIGKAKTGTGKTAAFAIPLIEKISPGQGFKALIVVPTRELAMQAKKEIAEIAIGSNLKTVAVFGGQSINVQADLLYKKPEIVVGTPGRLLDLFYRGLLNGKNVSFLILDEADKMFDMGFREDIEKIIHEIPRERQTMLFSATMPEEILELTEQYMKQDKIFFDLSEDESPVAEVEQFYMMVDRKQKVSALQRIIKTHPQAKTLVFCRTKRTVDWLSHELAKRGVKAFAIHGDKPQNMRNRIMEKYKGFRGGVLIATDLVARGIHVDDIDNVINFDFPQEPETYIHRIGRTARQGKKGRAISFCSNVLELEHLERTGSRHNAQIQELR
ncbi:MAG: DEAD/DEAH box helicase [Candidatus Diapherotrites archaeon]|nr:DEAD/DEAH box helicase [Candidatus Diapherotrites archaeon]